MGQVGLFLSGAALFLNSMMLSGKAEAKSVAVFNLFIGVLQIVFPFYSIIVSDQANWTVYGFAATFLFGLTYLFVGCTFLKGMHGSGLGWFSLWVSVVAVMYTVIAAVHFHNYVDALTWASWVVLWFLFYLLNSMDKPIEKFVSKVAFIQSWITLTLPAMFYFIGVWDDKVLQRIWLIVLLLSFVYYAVEAVKLKGARHRSVLPS
ncbi:AmiS/UreI family transporter [Bacillus testis]|uniref:AmiS/UreI family transporter n=1 Tax=Bacillus testis TaxID=1622072 RepID=UPI00067F5B7C|nr:AmiS/UreI family transporter [Bacillus testis]